MWSLGILESWKFENYNLTNLKVGFVELLNSWSLDNLKFGIVGLFIQNFETLKFWNFELWIFKLLSMSLSELFETSKFLDVEGFKFEALKSLNTRYSEYVLE